MIFLIDNYKKCDGCPFALCPLDAVKKRVVVFCTVPLVLLVPQQTFRTAITVTNKLSIRKKNILEVLGIVHRRKLCM